MLVRQMALPAYNIQTAVDFRTRDYRRALGRS